MAGEKLQAPRGTFDVLPEQGERRLALLRSFDDLLGDAGYGVIETPIFEHTELFARGVGETTDIVQKEMFTFEDQGGRSLTLRPEGTAAVVRAYLEHGMHKQPQPVKLRYAGPFFRHEAPQAGRYRQFAQLGAEAIGSDDPSLDAEVIVLLRDLLHGAGARQLRLRIGSLGTPETRRDYSDELRSYLQSHSEELSDEVRSRIDANPLRAFDSDHRGTQAVMERAPLLLDRIGDDDREHFEQVRELLDAAKVDYEVDPKLVRGLDYYTRTVFEFTSDSLGAQSGVAGGGRYDLLAEQIGGPHVPGVGFAAGVERILLSAGEPERAKPTLDVFVASEGEADRVALFSLLTALRASGLRAQMEQAGRSIKGQLKQADRLGARRTVIAADGAWRVRDMESGEQREVGTVDEVLKEIAG
jgi:histidyl-tRNA synthetase